MNTAVPCAWMARISTATELLGAVLSFFLDQTARLICTSPFRMNSGASAVESEILTLAGFCLVDNWFFLLKLRRDSSGSNSVGRMPASHSGSLSIFHGRSQSISPLLRHPPDDPLTVVLVPPLNCWGILKCASRTEPMAPTTMSTWVLRRAVFRTTDRKSVV